MEASNVKAMREALCEIVLLTMKVGFSIRGDVACGIIASKAKHALRRLPRQCDVGSPQEQAERYEVFCLKYFAQCSSERPCSGCPLAGQEDSCQFAWAQMPYEGGSSGSK